jgi:hypothetical protein
LARAVFYCLKKLDASSQAIKTLIVPLVVAPVIRVISCKQWYPHALEFLFQGPSSFCQFDCLAYGCLAAVGFYSWRADLKSWLARNPRWSPHLKPLSNFTPPGIPPNLRPA